ncbi:hypothetical protein [Variovorax sp.]|jgi:hypothetical protein|uniref:hypothetical protein n=1 Tax=Variovorax sp. TaxID=1871043 RepID=UPI0037D9959E
MHNNPGRVAHPKPAAAAPIEFSEEQLLAFDRARAAAKDSGLVVQMKVDAALRMDLAHQRGAA